MNKTRQTQLLSLFMATCSMYMTGCTTDNNVAEHSTESALMDAGSFKFRLTKEDFGTDTAMTRAASVSISLSQDLSDDCEVQTTISTESMVRTQGVETRSTPLQDGVYSIIAFQGNVRKGKIKGTISGGGTVFTPSPGTSGTMSLSHGTYTFICLNDKVEDDGTNIKVSQTNAGTAMVGVAKDYVINQDPNQYVPFVMRHVGARVRIKFVAQKHIPAGIRAKIGNSVPVPTVATLNPATLDYTYSNGATLSATECSYPASDNATQPLYSHSNYGETYSYTSEDADGYCYVLPTTDASSLKLDFSGGKVFRQQMNGKTLPKLMTANYLFMPNLSYCITIKMSPVYTYLFHDGTTGSIKNKGTRKPIAIVVRDNDGTPDSGLAMGLWKSGEGRNWLGWPEPNDLEGGRCFNACQYPVFADAYNTNNGYEETWTPVFPPGVIKAEVPLNSPIPASVSGLSPNPSGDEITWFGGSFWDAGQYTSQTYYWPGIILTNGMENKKWFLPSLGELKEALKNIGFFEESTITGTEQFGSWYGKLEDKAFGDVSGSHKLTASGPNAYHTSTEYDKTFDYSIHFGFGGNGFFSPTPDKVFKIILQQKYGGTGASRAFVHF
ncbi:MAG: hypothetical protein PUH24_06260 [Prevotellaceae bacterium]|nr:hypothetical protein [Prevotella sp.]MDD7257855.1 hypothetical protein [Prevotellaceae bacterium]MDY6130559.1 hypothetical protein [Prevotella sp.]